MTARERELRRLRLRRLRREAWDKTIEVAVLFMHAAASTAYGLDHRREPACLSKRVGTILRRARDADMKGKSR